MADHTDDPVKTLLSARVPVELPVSFRASSVTAVPGAFKILHMAMQFKADWRTYYMMFITGVLFGAGSVLATAFEATGTASPTTPTSWGRSQERLVPKPGAKFRSLSPQMSGTKSRSLMYGTCTA